MDGCRQGEEENGWAGSQGPKRLCGRILGGQVPLPWEAGQSPGKTTEAAAQQEALVGLARAEEGGVGERAVPEKGQAVCAPGWQMLAGSLAAPREVGLHALRVRGSHRKLLNRPLVLSGSVESRSAPEPLVPHPPA